MVDFDDQHEQDRVQTTATTGCLGVPRAVGHSIPAYLQLLPEVE